MVSRAVLEYCIALQIWQYTQPDNRVMSLTLSPPIIRCSPHLMVRSWKTVCFTSQNFLIGVAGRTYHPTPAWRLHQTHQYQSPPTVASNQVPSLPFSPRRPCTLGRVQAITLGAASNAAHGLGLNKDAPTWLSGISTLLRVLLAYLICYL